MRRLPAEPIAAALPVFSSISSPRHLRRACRFLRDNVQHRLFAAAQNRQSDLYPDLLFGQEPVKIVNARNRVLPVSNNDVAFFEAGATRRAHWIPRKPPGYRSRLRGC